MTQGQALIAERVEARIANHDLWRSVESLLKTYPPVQRSSAFGGWALQSTNGSYRDGWSMDFCPYNGPGNKGPTWTPRNDRERTLPPIQDYTQPTEVLTPTFQALLEDLEQKGLNPRRGRIIKLAARSATVWHQDGSRRFYQARLHIPLLTNEDCFFETDQGSYHMPADGALYFVHINHMHRAVNNSDQDRYHFVAHIWDRQNITQFHRYDPQKNWGETVHEDEIAPGSLFRRS